MTSGTPEELLSDLARLRQQARTARHAYWFPLVLFGLLTCASVPFYVSDVIQPAPGVAILRATPPPTLLGGELAGRNGVFLAWYWAFALVVGHLLTWAWYRQHQRRAGIQTPARAFAITGIVLAALAFLGPLFVTDLSFPYPPVGVPIGDLWVRGTFAFLIAAAGLWVLAWAERSRALALITLAYTGAALLASLYNVENLLYRLGWNPGYGSASARLTMLPNVLLPALVLLIAGAGAFLLRPRPARA
jgi:FtsH-binding integral membrane protein